VHVKLNSNTKHVSASSKHSKTVLKEIPRGVMDYLFKLITMSEERNKMKIEELYSEKIMRLKKNLINF